MLFRENMLLHIRFMLGGLASSAKQGADVGRTDTAKGLEHICMRLMNIMYSGHFRNMNTKGANYPAIDFADPDLHIAVQVTIDSTRAKIQHTLDMFLAHDMDLEFPDQLIIIVFTERVNISKEVFPDKKYAEKNFHFSVDEDVWDLQRLNIEIEKLDDDELEEIFDFLRRETGMGDFLMVYGVPEPAAGFVPNSRDADLDALVRAVHSGKNVYISGPGGIGKSQIAIQLAKHLSGERIVWFIPFVASERNDLESMEETILRAEIFRKPFVFGGEPVQRKIEFSERLKILEKECRKALIIIDGFEQPGKTLEGLQMEGSFRQLVSLGIQFVFTTRYPVGDSAQWCHVEISQMQDEILLQMLRRHCDAPEKELMALIRAVSGHTLTVEMIGRTLKNSNGRLKPGNVLRALRDGAMGQTDFPEIEYNHKQLPIYDHLLGLFRLAALSDTDQTVMRYAALLPPEGMEVSVFARALSTAKTTAPLKKRGLGLFARKQEVVSDSELDALNRIVEGGWLTRNHRISMHPMIQLVCRNALKPDGENCSGFLDRLLAQYDFEGPYDGNLCMELYQFFYQAVRRLEKDSRGRWHSELQRLAGRLDSTQAQLYHGLRTLNAMEQDENVKPLDMALYYGHISRLYEEMKDFSQALDFGEKALAIREQNPTEEPRKLAELHDHLAEIYETLGSYSENLSHRLRGVEIWKQILTERSQELPKKLRETAWAYFLCGAFQSALVWIEQAILVVDSLDFKADGRIVPYYHVYSIICGSLGNYSSQLEFALKALDVQERSNLGDHNGRAVVMSCIGDAYKALGDFKHALDYQLQAMEIRQRILPPDHPDLANSYSKVASTYGALGDHEKALEYALKDLSICEKKLPPDHPDLAICYGNVAYTYGALGDHEKELEYDLKALGIREKKLPPDHPDLATSYNNIGITYASLDEYQRSLEYLEKALAIFEKKLPAGHPYTESTRKSIADVKEKMAAQEQS